MDIRKFILIFSLLTTSIDIAKSERYISIYEIHQWYNSADLVILCTVTKEKEIFISDYDSAYSDGSHHKCTNIKMRYFINIDSVQKSKFTIVRIDSIETPEIIKGMRVEKESLPKFTGFDSKGDSIMTVEISINPHISSSYEWLKLDTDRKNWVFLKKQEMQYEIIYTNSEIDFLNDMKRQVEQEYRLNDKK